MLRAYILPALQFIAGAVFLAGGLVVFLFLGYALGLQ